MRNVGRNHRNTIKNYIKRKTPDCFKLLQTFFSQLINGFQIFLKLCGSVNAC